jgi:hypothetical protein
VTQPRRPTAPQRSGRPLQARVSSPREQVLARRRLALLGLAAAIPVTLVVAIVTGSVPLLIVNIVVGILFAGYVAMLLQIKQNQQRVPRAPARPRQDDEVRVTPRR